MDVIHNTNRRLSKMIHISYIENNRLIGIQMFIKFFENNYLVLFKNTDHYFNGIYSVRHRIIVYLMYMNLWLNAIRCLVIYLYPNEQTNIILANPLILIKSGNIISLLFSGGSLLFIIFGNYIFL